MKSFIINKFVHVSGCQAPVVIYSGFRTQARFQKSKKWKRNKTKQFRKAKERKERKTKTNTSRKSIFYHNIVDL